MKESEMASVCCGALPESGSLFLTSGRWVKEYYVGICSFCHTPEEFRKVEIIEEEKE